MRLLAYNVAVYTAYLDIVHKFDKYDGTRRIKHTSLRYLLSSRSNFFKEVYYWGLGIIFSFNWIAVSVSFSKVADLILATTIHSYNKSYKCEYCNYT